VGRNGSLTKLASAQVNAATGFVLYYGKSAPEIAIGALPTASGDAP